MSTTHRSDMPINTALDAVKAGTLPTLGQEIDFEVETALAAGDLPKIYNTLAARMAPLPTAQVEGLKAKIRLKFSKDFKERAFDNIIRNERVKTRAAAVISIPWQRELLRTEAGSPKPILANAIIALRDASEWTGVLASDAFAVRTVKCVQPPFSSPAGYWTDEDDIAAADWLQHQGVGVSTGVASEAVQSVARLTTFHPVRDWLTTLVWDGVSRIDKFLPIYFGTEDTTYTRAIGHKWLISAIARVMNPGCQADHCLILEGEQGIRKSTALRTLAGQWFTDDVEDLGTKDSAMQIHGVWIVELGELDAMRRSEISRVKAFLGRRIDHFRPPYGRRTADFPRQCIFAGSTNQSTYLNDETGARRFWPVACRGDIDIDALEADRSNIWAEALARYNEGVIWWIEDQSVLAETREAQRDRYEQDPWDGVVWDWIKEQEKTWNEQQEYRRKTTLRPPEPYSITSDEVLNQCIKKKMELWIQGDKNRIARILKSHGMERFNKRVFDEDGKPLLRPDGLQEREWRYRRSIKDTSQNLFSETPIAS